MRRLLAAALLALLAASPASAQWGAGGAWGGAQVGVGSALNGGTANRVVVTDASGNIATDADLQFDGTILSGPAAIRTGDGSAAAPAYAFSGDIDTGFALFPGGGATYVTSGGTYRMRFGTSLILRDGIAVCFDASGDPDGCESSIIRDAANTLAQRNGTNAQAFRLYNTWTDASNNEYLDFLWSGNAHYIRTFKTGSGLARTLYLRSASTLYLQSEGGSQSWAIAAGHLKPETDNAYDIGASGATRPRTGYFGTSVVAPLFESTLTGTSQTAANSAHYVGDGIGYEGATADGFEMRVRIDDPLSDYNTAFVRQFSATYDPADLAANTQRCDAVTVTGIVSARPVTISPGVAPAAACVVASVRASATNTVEVCWQNSIAAATCDTGSSTWVFAQPAGAA